MMPKRKVESLHSPVSFDVALTHDDKIQLHAMFKYHAVELCDNNARAIADSKERVLKALLEGVAEELERLRNG